MSVNEEDAPDRERLDLLTWYFDEETVEEAEPGRTILGLRAKGWS